MAIQRAPEHLIFNDDYFDQLRYERRFPEALEQAKKLFLLNTNWVLAVYDLGVAFADVGQFDAAIPWIQQARDMDDGPDFVGMHGNILARAGKTAEARQLLDKLEQSSSIRYISGAHRAMIYVGLHDVEQAILCLEKDAVERTRPLMDLKVEPLWDELRSDARFGAILKRMGLEK